MAIICLLEIGNWRLENVFIGYWRMEIGNKIIGDWKLEIGECFYWILENGNWK